MGKPITAQAPARVRSDRLESGPPRWRGRNQPPGGRTDRPEPDRPGQARQAAPPRRRPARGTSSADGDRGQSARLGGVRGAGRCHPERAWTAGPSALSPRQAPCRQGIRLCALSPASAQTGHRAAHCAPRSRESCATGQASLGSQAHTCLVGGFRQAAHALRAPYRHPHGAARPRLCCHVLSTRLAVLLATRKTSSMAPLNRFALDTPPDRWHRHLRAVGAPTP